MVKVFKGSRLLATVM